VLENNVDVLTRIEEKLIISDINNINNTTLTTNEITTNEIISDIITCLSTATFTDDIKIYDSGNTTTISVITKLNSISESSDTSKVSFLNNIFRYLEFKSIIDENGNIITQTNSINYEPQIYCLLSERNTLTRYTFKTIPIDFYRLSNNSYWMNIEPRRNNIGLSINKISTETYDTETNPAIGIANIDFTKYKNTGFTISYYVKAYNLTNERIFCTSFYFIDDTNTLHKHINTYSTYSLSVNQLYFNYDGNNVYDGGEPAWPVRAGEDTSNYCLYNYLTLTPPIFKEPIADIDTDNNVVLVSTVFYPLKEYNNYSLTTNTNANLTSYTSEEFVSESIQSRSFFKRLNDTDTNVSKSVSNVVMNNIYNNKHGWIIIGDNIHLFDIKSNTTRDDVSLNTEIPFENWKNNNIDLTSGDTSITGNFNYVELSQPMFFGKALTYDELETLGSYTPEEVYNL
jgi:hypothetical protein